MMWRLMVAVTLITLLVVPYFSLVTPYPTAADSWDRYGRVYLVDKYQVRYYNEQNANYESQRREAEQQLEKYRQQVAVVKEFLVAQGSPIAPYTQVVMDAARRCDGDYKTLLAIAKIESGFGRIPYKKYNPYGYLNGVQYGGWQSALDRLSCIISRQYIQKYGDDFWSMGKLYASNPKWGDKIYNAYQTIP